MHVTKMIPITDRKDKRCIFCGAAQSVKYEIHIDDNAIAPMPFDAYCCNMCVIRKGISMRTEAKRQSNHERNLPPGASCNSCLGSIFPNPCPPGCSCDNLIGWRPKMR